MHSIFFLKVKNPSKFNNTYLSTAIKWAIRNEVRRRYKWYSLKNKTTSAEDEASDIEFRADVYKNILSIDELQDAEVPTQIKSNDKTPEETIEFTELKDGILEAMKNFRQEKKNSLNINFSKKKT